MSETVEIIINAKDQASGVLKGVSGGLSSLGNVATTLAKGALLGLTAGVAALGTGLGIALSEAMEAQQGISQLEAVLKSTGGAAGVTKDMALDLADSLSGVTRFSDDAVLAGENLLLTFTNIGADVFPRATETLLDMATAMGTDAKSGAIQLGKALNDPVAGITALTRVGVTFTDEQKKMIESMVAAGDVAGAQTIILDELQKEFGGSAEAAGQTFAGQLDILKNSLLNVAEGIGMALLPTLQGLTAFVTESVIPWIQGIGEGLSALIGVVNNLGFEALFTTMSDGTTVLGTFFTTLGLGQPAAEAIVVWLGGLKENFDNFLLSLQPVIDAFINLYNAFIESLPLMLAQGEAFKTWFNEAFGITFPQLIANFTNIINGLAELWRQHGDTVMAVVDGFMRVVMTTIGGALTIITGLLAAALALMQGDTQGALDIIQNTFNTFFETVLSLVGTNSEEFNATWAGTFELMGIAWNTWSTDTATAIQTWFDGILLAVSTWALNFLTTWETNWNNLQLIVETVFGNITATFNTFKQTINSIIERVQALINKILAIPGVPGGDDSSNTTTTTTGTDDQEWQTTSDFSAPPPSGSSERSRSGTPRAGNTYILNINNPTGPINVLDDFAMLQQLAGA